MKNQDTSLNPEWARRIKQVGMRAFEVEEMLRLGFLEPNDLNIEEFEKAALNLKDIRNKLQKTNIEIESLNNVEIAIDKIRSKRIKDVKIKAELRKVNKEKEKTRRLEENKSNRINCPNFLGREVSNRLKFIGGDEELVIRNGLPKIISFLDLSSALGLDPKDLQWLVYSREDSSVDHYTRFYIPKRSGEKRLISSPKPILRKAQSWVLNEILEKIKLHPAAMAFRSGVSILDNASLHVKKEIVLRIDLKDFFPSIVFPRVRGFYESLGYNPGVASVLALLCTDSPRVLLKQDDKSYFVEVGERCLPQGACTSPNLANLISNNLDKRISAYAEKSKWIYSRYADDLILSTKEKIKNPQGLINGISKIISDEGFVVNQKKTRIMRKSSRQIVTGLLVNDGVRLTKRDLHRFRAFLHNCEIKGIEKVSNEIGKDAVSFAKGYLSYINMISPLQANKFLEKNNWLLSKK